MNINTNEKIEAIAAKAAETLRELICESADDIIAAIAEAATQAQEKFEETGDEQPLKVVPRNAIKLDLVGNRQVSKLSWTVSHTREKDEPLPDPENPELPLDQTGKGRKK